MSLATGAITNLNCGPYQGKETGETALLRSMLDSFQPGDVVVMDRYFCSFMMLAMLHGRGVHACTRQHQRRSSDLRQGRRLGKHDRLMTWTRPERPVWMDPTEYARIPEALEVRVIRFTIREPGRRTREIEVVTTLTDAECHSCQPPNLEKMPVCLFLVAGTISGSVGGWACTGSWTVLTGGPFSP